MDVLELSVKGVKWYKRQAAWYLTILRYNPIETSVLEWHSIYKSYEGFLSHGGTPSHHPFLFRIFHEINHPAIVFFPMEPHHLDTSGFIAMQQSVPTLLDYSEVVIKIVRKPTQLGIKPKKTAAF